MIFLIFLTLFAICIWIIGELTAGRFVVYTSGVVLDSETSLEWYAGDFDNMDYEEALSWIKNLNEAAFRGGGWRIPTMQELEEVLLLHDVSMEFEKKLVPGRIGLVYSTQFCHENGRPSTKKTDFVLCRSLPGGNREPLSVSDLDIGRALAVRSTLN